MLRCGVSHAGMSVRFFDANTSVLIAPKELWAKGLERSGPASIGGHGGTAAGRASGRVRVRVARPGAGPAAIFKGGHGYQRDNEHHQCQEDAFCDKEPPAALVKD